MKLSKISLGVAVACGVVSAPALAITASNFDATTKVVRISGATAQDSGVLESTLRICTAGTLHAYTASNQFAYLCTISAGTSTTLGGGGSLELAVFKHSVGGSGNGVAPINSATATLPFLDLTAIAGNALACPGTAVATAPSGLTYNLSACTTLLTSAQVAAIGISDVEPSFFGGSADFNNLSVSALATVIFGVPVTKNVYDKLQTAQGIVGTCAASLVEACMPSLSTGQITTLYTQEGQTWDAVTGITGLGNDNQVFVSRRADTSGTQKTYEALIARTANGTPSGKSCQPGVDLFVSGAAALDNTVAATACNGDNLVVNGSGSGQVAFCMNAHQTAGRGSIGTLTTEFLTGTATGAGSAIRFVKINRLAPTAANVRSGEYTAYGDASLNTNVNKLPVSTVNGRAVANGFLTLFKSNFAVATVSQPFGTSGLETLNVVTGNTLGNPYNRLVSGELNNCQQGRL